MQEILTYVEREISAGLHQYSDASATQQTNVDTGRHRGAVEKYMTYSLIMFTAPQIVLG